MQKRNYKDIKGFCREDLAGLWERLRRLFQNISVFRFFYDNCLMYVIIY